MTHFERNGASLYYEYDGPIDRRQTFVFVNALTGSAAAWQAEIGPALRAAGYGTLAYDMRGQANSPARSDDILEEQLIVADLQALLEHVAPPAPILVGLSIGGLFAARAWLEGSAAEGMVLINTLRKPGLTLDWINEAVARTAALGGQQLVMDLFLPLLVGPGKLAELRENCLGEQPYEPFAPEAGPLRLLMGGRMADWDLPYEKLTLPILVLTGLRDRVFLDRDAVAELVGRLPDAREQVFPDLGHLIPVEDGPALAAALRAFAEETGSRS
jgi:pimeloyl-ACP methyl ester carboxylesterase